MRTLHALLCLSLLCSSTTVHAECACLWEGSFSEVQQSADLVIAARVLNIKGNAVDVEVEETLRGRAYLENLRVWMETRDYCRPPAEDFPVDSRWVFALKRITELPSDGFDPSTPNQSFGRVDDYYLSSCGGYWLNYSGEAVTGNLVNAPRWARDPDMTPVLMDLLRAFLRNEADGEALLKASREDPALTDLMLDTKAFLRGDEGRQ
ncbi:delta-aminolevulinic acid dehydratase [Congregibacter brevis]|uniref:Delta-aminolevulinic acid dehydratase n=1 Tax=Congregibacter brevis TaxID=3081201 RepID=A0ABZ0ICY0_9GAMM|nr:delta-aminolevulinic acid dehydratase [Congregibacter sp. IMCC45268]